MKNSDLSKRLSALGFTLLEAQETHDANETLADVVKSKDLRLWEGFAVVLANSAERQLFDYNKVKMILKKPSLGSCLSWLVTMSLALYKVLNLKFTWADKLYKSFSKEEKKTFNNIFNRLKRNEDFSIAGNHMSSLRLKATFNNYFNQSHSKLNDLLLVKEEFGLEYSLSCVFSPKQKELFLKKLREEKLTKTEKEYFSRVVKKKVLALANPQLHRLSRKLLEQV